MSWHPFMQEVDDDRCAVCCLPLDAHQPNRVTDRIAWNEWMADEGDAL